MNLLGFERGFINLHVLPSGEKILYSLGIDNIKILIATDRP